MKKILLLTAVAIMSFCGATAQSVSENIVKKTFLTSIHCPNCEKRVLNNVEALGDGVKSVEVNLEKKEVTVEYDANVTNAENLIAGFKKIRVEAKEVTAAEHCGKCQHGAKEGAATCDKEKKDCCKEKKAEAVEKKDCCKEKKADAVEKKDCCKEKKADAVEKKECCKEKKAEAVEKKECCKEKKAEKK